ncbi:MAG: trypsin-like serine protease [Pirellulaceae bacterium]|nr:trypsin-like serine protease [Planctomycetales bacterium]
MKRSSQVIGSVVLAIAVGSLRPIGMKRIERWIIAFFHIGILCLGGTSSGITIRDDIPPDVSQLYAAGEQYVSAGAISNVGCSGALIHPQWAITAAHCVPGGSAGKVDFSLGAESSDWDTTVSSDGWIRHPSFTGNTVLVGNDFALVHLKTPILEVTPVRVYQGVDRIGLEVTVVGYGMGGTGSTGARTPYGIRRAATNMVSTFGAGLGWSKNLLVTDFDNPATSADSQWDPTTPTFLEGAVGVGDSGSAWYGQFGGKPYLVGITSFRGGADEASNSDYGDFSVAGRVSLVADWIRQQGASSSFWNGGDGQWGATGNWYGGSPGAEGAAVIESGFVQVDEPRQSTGYVLVNGGTLQLNRGIAARSMVVSGDGVLDIADATALISLEGDYRQDGGILRMQVDGSANGVSYDHFSVGGVAQLGGTLNLLINTTWGGYVDPVARGGKERVVLLDAARVEGEFHLVRWNRELLMTGVNYVGSNEFGQDGMFRVVEYSKSLVSVTSYLARPGDANGDFRVDDADLAVLLRNQARSNLNWNQGDFNGDGVINAVDLSIWTDNRARSSSSPGMAIVAVPEPVVTSWLAIVMICGMRSLRRSPLIHNRR